MRTSHQEVFLFVATLAAALPTRGVPEPQPLRMGEYHSGQAKTRVVSSKYGRLQGFVSRVGRDAAEQRHVEIFLGVPYASPPVGRHRFAPTRPPIHWAGVRSAFKPGASCPQVLPDVSNRTEALTRMPLSRLRFLLAVSKRLEIQSEDCLFMNIFVPIPDGPSSPSSSGEGSSSSSSDRYPVMVFLHGESYSWGSGNLYDGRVLAAYGKVIVVSFNFRLGVFGFLNTNVSPGRKPAMANYGLMDSIAALKWLQENVAAFGGDPQKVTLFGHRTGAALVQFLMHSPAVVPGLFHRAIMMSGSAFSSWALVDDPVHYAVKLAAALNCSIPRRGEGRNGCTECATEEVEAAKSEFQLRDVAAEGFFITGLILFTSSDVFLRNMLSDHEKIVSCLRTKSIEELTKFNFGTPSFLSSMGPSKDGIVIPNDFGADVEGDRAKRAQNAASYQVILGLVDDETLEYFSEKHVSQGVGPRTRDKYLRTLIRNNYDFHLNEIFATVQNEYSDWLSSEIRPIHLLQESSRALTDKLYLAPITETANWLNQSGCPVYFYVFQRQNNLKMIPTTITTNTETATTAMVSARGMRRSSLLPLIFGLPFAPELQQRPEWRRANADASAGAIAQRMLAYWTNFAVSGDPNRPHDLRSLFPRQSERAPNPVWERYGRGRQSYLEIGLSPRMRTHFRLHSLSVWLHLVPKLHSAGASNIFPQHNAFAGHDDPDLFTGVVRPGTFSHGYQVNRKFFDSGTSPSPPAATTCLPVNARGQVLVGGGMPPVGLTAADNKDLVHWEKASEHAYRQAMYLTIGLGTLLLAVNVWFLICLFFCRSRFSCCFEDRSSAAGASGGLEAKEYSCQTELVGLGTNDSVQSFREIAPPSQQGSRRLQTSHSDSLNRAHDLNDTQESLRLLHSSDSDRESRSTSSQSQCVHRSSERKYHPQEPHRNSISYTTTSGEAPEHHRQHHQQHAQLVRHNHPMSKSPSCSSTLPTSGRKHCSSSSQASDRRPSSSSNGEVFLSSTLRHQGSKLQHTLDSNCRLHDLSSSSGEGISSKSSRTSTREATAAEGMISTNELTALTGSSQALSMVLPPSGPCTKENQQGQQPLASSLKKPKASDASVGGNTNASSSTPSGKDVPKLTTFSSPLEITHSELSTHSPSGLVVSFGGETILQ